MVRVHRAARGPSAGRRSAPEASRASRIRSPGARVTPAGVALALVVLAAAVLRLGRIGADLPDFLEEDAPFRTALEMWGVRGAPATWHPNSFIYPSLSIYLHLLVQLAQYAWLRVQGVLGSPADWIVLYSIDPTPMVLPARCLHVAFGLVTVLLAARIAERLRRGAGLPAALLVAFSPTLIATSRLVYTDTLMTMLALAALERMLAWHARGGRARLVASVVLIGLAAGTKYPAAVVLVPLAWILWSREGVRGLARWPLAALGAAGVFLLTTPYALFDAATFLRDLRVNARHLAIGHFGQSATGVRASYLEQLLRNLGWAGAALVLASGATTIRERRSPAIAVWLFLLAFLLPMAAARYSLEYYAIPILPAAAALAAAAAVDLPQRLPGRWRTAATAALLVALLVPALAYGIRAAAAGARSTQVEARRWLEPRIGARELVLKEPWGPKLLALTDVVALQPFLSAARPELRRRYFARPWFHVVQLPLSVSGRPRTRVVGPNGRSSEIEVFPSGLDANRIAYDPRILAMADLVVTSGAVRDRFEADPARFPLECRLYRLLDSTATIEARFAPGRSAAGPVITVYRIGPTARAALSAAGPLPPLWWAEAVPESYRRAASALTGTEGEAGSPLRADGTPSAWVRTLGPYYRDWVQPFPDDLATELVDLGRCDQAQPVLEGTLLVSPRDAKAAWLYEACAAEAPSQGR